MSKKKKNTTEEFKNNGTGTNEVSEQDRSQNNNVNDELQELQQKYDELNEKYLRLYSDFENYRKRTAKERLDIIRSGGEDVIRILLPIIDDFERALENMESAKDVNSVKEGVQLIYHKLLHELSQKGLKAMVAKGEEFDSDIHEAVSQTPAPSEDLKGKVVHEVEKGYHLNDKMLRCAKVVVGS